VDCSNDMYGRDGHIQEGEKDEAVSWNSAASMGCHSSPLTYSVDTVSGAAGNDPTPSSAAFHFRRLAWQCWRGMFDPRVYGSLEATCRRSRRTL
jgi:hypothetical protein